MLKSRSFNSVTINGDKVRKESQWKDKLRGEWNWFNSVPNNIKVFTPKMYSHKEDQDKFSYHMEFINGDTLSESLVNGTELDWQLIFIEISRFLDQCKQYKYNVIDTYSLYVEKTIKRLHEYGVSIDYRVSVNGELSPDIGTIIRHCHNIIGRNKQGYIIHGDLCFSNIILSGSSIKVIDPRGIDGSGKLSIIGDISYDIGKLAHSVIGGYDYILNGDYTYYEDGDSVYMDIVRNSKDDAIINQFTNSNLFNKDSYPVMVLLFLSMLPLHSDDKKRQKVLFANGIRLYNEMIKKLEL